ncbi:MAG: hypothetical protein HYT07_04090 [Candidatus Levybacteria bacterium]|nr:hypothetical protein [Candidatus Levybacteria bacterium]
MRLAERFTGLFKQRSHVERSFTPEEIRLKLESECEEIVNKVGFGIEDFGRFTHNMQSLLRTSNMQNAFILKDEVAGRNIKFDYLKNGRSLITIRSSRSKPRNLGNVERTTETNYESLSYEEPTGGSSEPRPYLTISFTVPVPKDIMFNSYVTGKSNPVFPEGEVRNSRSEYVTEKIAQDFCRKAYAVYSGFASNMEF